MITQTEGKIYLADQRGCTQLPWFRSFHTFNFGEYFNENRQPFGTLAVVNDETIAAENGMKMHLEENTEIMLLPIVGGIEYKDSFGNYDFLAVGQVQLFSAAKGMEYEVLNPYPSDLINFLTVWVKRGHVESFIPKSEQTIIDLQLRNQLLPVFTCIHQDIFGYIGKYGGRKEGVYSLQKAGNGIFAFVIEGVFEVQDRLLHARDGLALWNVQEVDFEALSNDAIILLLEIPL